MLRTTLFITGMMLIGFSAIGLAQNSDEALPPTYDAKLAEQLGADEYGMKNYVFVILKTGSVTIADPVKSKEIFRGHFANMGRLASEKKLLLAGPFMEGGEKRGMYIFNVSTLDEAEALVKTDPAVAAGVFDYDLTQLYCSAALLKLGEIHASIQKTKIE